MRDVLRKVHNQLKTVRVKVLDGKKSKSRQALQISQQKKLHWMIKKIKLALEKYEATDAVLNWEISSSVGVYYGGKFSNSMEYSW